MNFRLILALAGIYIFTLSNVATASVVTIDFEADSIGTKANGFTPTGITGVAFSDSNGAELGVYNLLEQGSGTRSLLVGGDLDGSLLQISLGYTADFLSLDFGNDDINATNAGDLAVLTTFLGSTQVGQTTVVLNRDDVMNQTISIGSIGNGILFDNATFAYTNPLFSTLTGGGAANIGLSEAVDNIQINSAVIPIPAAIWLFISGLICIYSFSSQRRKVLK